MRWLPEHDALIRDLGQTEPATIIAARLGVSRSAVLGRAHRKGISLKSPAKTERDFAAMGRHSSGRKGKTLPASHPAHRSRPKGTHAFSFNQRVHAVAARLAGASRTIAAREVGASPVTLNKLWEKDQAVVAAARVVLGRAIEDAHTQQRARAHLLSLQHQAAMTHNHRILLGWGDRNRTIVLRKLWGESLAVIARDYGITRERARQILVRAIEQGILAPPGINLQNDRVSG